MNNKLYSFYELIEDIKQETGITNLRNDYTSISKMIMRAEKEINPYSTFYSRKTMQFFKGNGNFDGVSIKKPNDYIDIFIDLSRGAAPIREGKYRETKSHIIICDGLVRDNVIFTYWAPQFDSEGWPVISQNHAEAVLAFIIWKMYSPKIFMNEGNMNTALLYERRFDNRSAEARGEDFFPSEQSLNNMRSINASATIELNRGMMNKDCCLCCSTYMIPNDNAEIDDTMNNIVKFFQLDGPGAQLNPLDVTTEFLADKNEIVLSAATEGNLFTFLNVGRYGFAIYDVDPDTIQIVDIFNEPINRTLNYYYDLENRRIIFVSNEYVSPSSIYFKFIYNAE